MASAYKPIKLTVKQIRKWFKEDRKRYDKENGIVRKPTKPKKE